MDTTPKAVLKERLLLLNKSRSSQARQLPWWKREATVALALASLVALLSIAERVSFKAKAAL